MDRVSGLEMLNRFLLDQLAEGNDVVLLIDEAQDLEPELLEQVRLLSNLETDQRKLLQIVLIGQPELRDKLNERRLRQLRQRITVRYHLAPLSRGETEHYIRHRLHVAGGNGRPGFDRWALRGIHRYSRGMPRLINAVCDKALLCGFVAGTDQLRATCGGRCASWRGSVRIEPDRRGPEARPPGGGAGERGAAQRRQPLGAGLAAGSGAAGLPGAGPCWRRLPAPRRRRRLLRLPLVRGARGPGGGIELPDGTVEEGGEGGLPTAAGAVLMEDTTGTTDLSTDLPGFPFVEPLTEPPEEGDLEPRLVPVPVPEKVPPPAPPGLEPVPPPKAEPEPVEPPAPSGAAADGAETHVRRAPVPGGGWIELGGIAFSADQPVALLNGRVVSVGEVVEGFTVISIAPRRVELRGHGTTLVLTLD